MEKLPEKMNIPGVWIGDYCIRPFDDDQIVVENKSGESLVCDKSDLEPLVMNLFNTLF